MDRSQIAGIYLAAGSSSRMGMNKLDLPVGEFFLGSMGLRAALKSRLSSVIVVTRKRDSLHWLAPFSINKKLRIVICEEAGKGQSASLKTGIMAARVSGTETVVVLLADQPFVTAEMINVLIEEFHRSPYYSFVSFSNDGFTKPPVLLTKSFFFDIEGLNGDQGARALIRNADETSGKLIAVKNDQWLIDVDTLADYERLFY